MSFEHVVYGFALVLLSRELWMGLYGKVDVEESG